MVNSHLPKQRYLTCERHYIFELLIFAGGMLGAYTYNLRGGVFCNAQTANVMLMALRFGKGEFRAGLYYLIPIAAYLLGTVVSEVLPARVRKIRIFRWDTYLILFEIAVLFCLGFVPLDDRVTQVIQVVVNIIASMQYNTFRQAEGVTMATTFVTNHIRQTGIWFVVFLKNGRREDGIKCLRYLGMVLIFFAGGAVLTVFCGILKEKAVWLIILPLAVSFILLAYADLRSERGLLDSAPHGHGKGKTSL